MQSEGFIQATIKVPTIATIRGNFGTPSTRQITNIVTTFIANLLIVLQINSRVSPRHY
jgi:hypothetical protein